MKESYKRIFGSYTTVHYYNPGEHLTYDELTALHADLRRINARRSQPIKHRLLDSQLTGEELVTTYAQSIVGLLYDRDEAVGFLISPILRDGPVTVVHAGLVVISRNYGDDLLGLLSLGLGNMIQRKCPNAYVTNISSTPSILEVFTKLVDRVWPDPDANLVKAPKGYRHVFDLLYNNYILRYFPSPESISADSRRFVISTKSQGMGFNTNLRELSRSSQMKFISFCWAWIDYAKEEDVVQVGIYTWRSALKGWLVTAYLQYIHFPRQKPRMAKVQPLRPVDATGTLSEKPAEAGDYADSQKR